MHQPAHHPVLADELIVDTLVSMFSGGHLLLEGVPGLGKTYLVNVLSQVLGLTSGRIQCTPDLMPADILGTHIVNEDAGGRRVFEFEKGPVFRHLPRDWTPAGGQSPP